MHTTTTTTTTAAVLRLLTGEDRPWTVAELARETGEELATVDAVAELCGAGLAHRIPPVFVMASRAALHAAQIDLGGDE
jgi:hypothetical protein